MHYLTQPSLEPSELGNTVLILRMRSLKRQELAKVTQGDTANQKWSWMSNPRLLSEPMYSANSLCCFSHIHVVSRRLLNVSFEYGVVYGEIKDTN